jgi:hypothetical protein
MGKKKQPNETKPALIRREEAMLRWAWIKYASPDCNFAFDYDLFTFLGLDHESVPYAAASELPPEDVPAVLDYWRQRVVNEIDAVVAKSKALAMQRAQQEQREQLRPKPNKPKKPKQVPELTVVSNGQGDAR